MPRSSAPYGRDNRADCQHANHCKGDQGSAEEQKECEHGENTDNQKQHRAVDRPQLRDINASSRPNVGRCPDPRTDIHGSAGRNDFRLCPRLLASWGPEERPYIRASIAAVERATGIRPVGWSGPDFQETPNTPNLLAAEGIRYVCDWGNDEQPYRMTPQTGELYSLAVNAYLDDNYIHLHGRRTINEVNLLWREWFDGLYADGAATGRMMVLHLHPWIIGQPWRIRHLDEVLGHICARQGVWKATGGQIIDWFKSHSA
jgi:hypothetical protein